MKKLTRIAATMTVAASLSLGAVGLTAPTASAFSQAAFPLVARYNQGVDVLALQYLLQANGFPTLVADGSFGPGTDTAVKDFQTRKGLTRDGIVGSATWTALVPLLLDQNHPSGPAVKALQVLLNKKRSAALPVNGLYDTATIARVQTFQSHAGLTPDGDTGAVTWRNILWHYATPATTYICDKDPDNNGPANWGTGSGVGQFEAAAKAFSATGQGKVPYGDISKEHGGPLRPHASHQKGVDFDIWPIRLDSAQCTADRTQWNWSTYDRAATRQLVQAIRAAAPDKALVLIFFNDPVLINEGLTQQYVSHDNHLHVRYR